MKKISAKQPVRKRLPETLHFRRRMLIRMALVLAIMHIVYISSMLLYLGAAKDAASGAWYITTAELFLTIWALLLKYFLFGSVVTVFDSYQTSQSMPFTGVAVVSLVISRVGEILMYPLSGTKMMLEESRQLVYSVGTELIVDMAVLFVIFFISRSCSPKKLRRFTFMSIIICTVPTLYTIAERIFLWVIPAISEIAESANAITAIEIISMVSDALVFPIITGFAGLLIMLVTNDKYHILAQKHQDMKK